MFARKHLLFMLMIAALVLPALGILPSAGAQEGPKPEAIGLRPDAPPYGVHGPYWVGVIENEAETPSHPTKVLIWYPALNPEGIEEAITYYYDYKPDAGLLPIAGHALKDATPDLSGAPYPLVIYIHGHNGQRHGGNWLCEHLASQGFIVMSIDQADSQAATAGSPRFRERLQDVTWQLDYADNLTAAGAPLAGMINMDHVALTGHSAGGGTALQAGGSGGDPRVDAVVPMAPYGGEQAVTNGFTLPTLLMSGSKDEYLSYFQLQFMYDSLESTIKILVVFQLAHHYIFWYSCDVAPWFIPDDHIYCSDPVWEMDRVHDLANHYVTAFLLDVLKGDEDAHHVLRPSNQAYDGIEYESVGY